MEPLKQTLQIQTAQHPHLDELNEAAKFYEQAIESEPDQISHYWDLGLVYLLQGNEVEAQATWLYILSQCEEVQQSVLLKELLEYLDQQANYQACLHRLNYSWLIRQHIRALDPNNLNNALQLICLAIDLNEFNSTFLTEWQICKLLENSEVELSSQNLLFEALVKITENIDQPSFDLIKSCLIQVKSNPKWILVYLEIIRKIGYDFGQYKLAIDLLNCCLFVEPDNIDFISFLARFQLSIRQYQEAILSIRKAAELCQTPIQKTFVDTLLLKTLIIGGKWDEVPLLAHQFKQNLIELQNLPGICFDSGLLQELIVSTGNLAYIQDDLAENRQYQNLIAKLFLDSFESGNEKFESTDRLAVIKPREKTKKLKIGYVGSTFSKHSVSWLNRWLFNHHNKEEFEIYIYAFGEVINDSFFQTWFQPQAHFVTQSRSDVNAIIRKIKQDEIDILLDLDSYTLEYTCTVMAAKPAPIQVTWLGTDASGLSTIDYFIADPYVLPEHAQTHYQEKIWRLPQTYIAVDGFEVGYPTLNRGDLEIPAGAIVYLSSQAAFKRNPETVRLQLEIIKQVPNSYLLIKGLGDPEIIETYFTELAQEVGLNPDRLRFLNNFATEYDHRTNLQIADVILDTYPYSGATTTLEALWVGVPLVTRVGETFSSRNSYAFLMNAGVTEGIAQSAQEYIDWGVRFGRDEALRQDVTWKLYQSRNTSPLWDAKQFTREMEAAYKQMWQIYHASDSC